MRSHPGRTSPNDARASSTPSLTATHDVVSAGSGFERPQAGWGRNISQSASYGKKQNRLGRGLHHVRGGKGDGRKAVSTLRISRSGYSTAPVRSGGAGSLRSLRSRGIGTRRPPTIGAVSSENALSSFGNVTTGGAGCRSS